MKGSPNKNRKKAVQPSTPVIETQVLLAGITPSTQVATPTASPLTTTLFWMCVGLLVVAVLFV